MSKKVIALIVVGAVVAIATVLILFLKHWEYENDLKNAKSFNYANDLKRIRYISILGVGNSKWENIEITAQSEIEETICLLDSLEIVEKERSLCLVGFDKEHICFDLFAEDDEEFEMIDSIAIYNGFLIVFRHGYDWESTYYSVVNIKDSDSKNKAFQFVEDLISNRNSVHPQQPTH